MPNLDELKSQAKRLRASLAGTTPISHAMALEAIAKQHGYRDWNTIHAACANAPPAPVWQVGQIVTGAYMGHPVRGVIKSVSAWAEGRMTRLSIDLDDPVNVSAFDSFDVTRRRLKANIGKDGATVEKTSNGVPHLKLDF